MISLAFLLLLEINNQKFGPYVDLWLTALALIHAATAVEIYLKYRLR